MLYLFFEISYLFVEFSLLMDTFCGTTNVSVHEWSCPGSQIEKCDVFMLEPREFDFSERT
jgi:hypothetical protein